MARVALLVVVALGAGGCSLFGYFDEKPCDDQASCGGGDGDVDGDADGDADVEPVDMAGEYDLTITNGDNGCGFAQWTVGTITRSVPLTITQGDPGPADVIGIIGGIVGLTLRLSVGSDTLRGTVTGDDVEMSLLGQEQGADEGCTYRALGTAYGTLTGDALQGRVEYTYVIVHDGGNCGDKADCVSVQNFIGARPPQ